MEDSVKALELTGLFLKKAKTDVYYWKWVLVSLHNSIQGFMVCALRGKDGLNVLKDRVAERLIEAKQNNAPLPKPELDTFLNLYRKIQTDKMLMNPKSKKFIPGKHHDKSIRRLNRLRNHFIHFTPKSWSMEASTLPLMSVYCLQVIRFLAFSSGNISCNNQELRSRIGRTLHEIELALQKMQVETTS
ncbi:hypothetical protein Tfer_0338 [Thermincola ferriacetica]|uniref:Uncharacterized protein n=1 Tax=Thermincola ferriacetica TaxID=281456 RepID=A0A0L6W552_9FIRM|nr:hypothetical protein [Thermincola ferriacetica]KNZ70660.1 hypothetical protein Tfer_0338 [Thermincola ferriacetica]